MQFTINLRLINCLKIFVYTILFLVQLVSVDHFRIEKYSAISRATFHAIQLKAERIKSIFPQIE